MTSNYNRKTVHRVNNNNNNNIPLYTSTALYQTYHLQCCREHIGIKMFHRTINVERKKIE